ncbi:hypothetical protein [Plantibacter sp. YIM 135249]|uniref:hypothetical protein n=1 Tax=Plantibacter sp. YIM 135249 TaxID=3423918 RepID=UPI003D34F35A
MPDYPSPNQNIYYKGGVEVKYVGRKTAVALAVAVVLIGGFAQSASAAYNQYFSGDVARNVPKTSGFATISGARASLKIELADFYIHLTTFSPYPGYVDHGSTSGNAPGNVYLGHPAVANVKNQCFWSVGGGVAGDLKLTCAYSG